MFERVATASTIVIAAALVCAAPAAARSMALNPQPEPPGVARGADPMAAIYNNTVVVTNGQGGTEKLWFSPNHTFEWEGGKGQRGKGTWSLSENNHRICLRPAAGQKPTEPGETARPRCAEFVGGHKRGERWGQKNDSGAPVTIEIQ